MAEKTFLITGVSSGLGRAIARQALLAGHRVVGTVRQEAQIADFEALAAPNAFGRLLDVTDEEAVARVIDEVESTVGPIEVLVNNAGYGHEGAMEESTLEDMRRQFDVNVFGLVAVTKAVLPKMRVRRSGHIIFITSMGGLRSFSGLSFYNGSKFAVEGIAGSLRLEIAPFGIHVTAVEPGSFRTDWAGRSMLRAPRSIADYDETFGKTRADRLKFDGNQLGDPDKAGQAILTLVAAPNPPGHLLLGTDAVRLVRDARRAVDAEIEVWEELSSSTDFAEGGAQW